jgi:quinoprotein glucose dehydrogenase
MTRRALIGAAMTAVGALLSSTALAAGPNVDWPAYGGDNGGTRYSTLTQIDKSNVANLKQAWRIDMPAGSSEIQPIVIGRTLFAMTTDRKAIAVDAATGAAKWTHAFEGKGRQTRGLSYWSSGADHRLIVPNGAELTELNADTGELIAGFGQGGHIDLNANLRGDAKSNNVNMSSPAQIYKDVIITHGGVGETLPASPGDIRGWDIRTGKLLWTFHTIPHPGEPGAETSPPTSSASSICSTARPANRCSRSTR